MRTHSLNSFTASLALGALLLAPLQPATASALFAPVASVHVAVPGAESQAQLAAQLKAEGYNNVTLSSAPATIENPHPELNPSLTSAPEQATVRAGWNGVATKNGDLVQVYVVLR